MIRLSPGPMFAVTLVVALLLAPLAVAEPTTPGPRRAELLERADLVRGRIGIGWKGTAGTIAVLTGGVLILTGAGVGGVCNREDATCNTLTLGLPLLVLAGGGALIGLISLPFGLAELTMQRIDHDIDLAADPGALHPRFRRHAGISFVAGGLAAGLGSLFVSGAVHANTESRPMLVAAAAISTTAAGCLVENGIVWADWAEQVRRQ